MKIYEIFDEFLSYKRLQVKESTIAIYITLFCNHFPCRNDDIEKLSEKRINQFLLSEKKKKHLSDKTMYDIITLLNAFLKFAHDKRYAKNELHFATPNVAEPPTNIFNSSEIAVITDYMYKHTSFTGIGILLSLYCGLRIGEICALQWQDVDLENELIRVTKTLQRIKNLSEGKSKTKITITTPKKQKSIRDIPIPAFLIHLLKRYRGLPNWYVLTGDIKHMEPRTLQKRYAETIKEIGLVYRNFHALRHSFATVANNRGMDTKTLSELLGHEKVAFTLAKYVHPSMELKRAQMNSIYADMATP